MQRDGLVVTEDDRARWSRRVTRESNALDLEEGVFTWADPVRIARSLQASAEQSKRRKAGPFRSAMSMLAFYINRAGRNLDPQQKAVLEQAKDELRRLYGKSAAAMPPKRVHRADCAASRSPSGGP